MNKRTAKIYVIIENGLAITAATNLTTISDFILKIDPEISYGKLRYGFKMGNQFNKDSKDGRTFTFQVLENENYPKN